MIEREEEIASTIPADLGALPRLRWFRLRGMALRVIYYRPQTLRVLCYHYQDALSFKGFS